LRANPITVKLEPEIQERLKRLAAGRKRSPHWIMKEALREYVEREERAEQARRETLERWEQYAITGDTVSNEAIRAWLDTWGGDGETGRPPCGQ
jgi:predicted transcriptional regulator